MSPVQPTNTDPQFPRKSLKRALKVAETIWRANGGQPYAILDIAPAIGVSPKSSNLDFDLAAAHRYGLTNGASRGAKMIALMPRGRNIVAPGHDTNVAAEVRAALYDPPLFRRFYSHFDGKVLPPKNTMVNTLMRPESEGGYGLSKGGATVFADVVLANAKEFNLIQDVNGTHYLRMDRLSAHAPSASSVSADSSDEEEHALDDGVLIGGPHQSSKASPTVEFRDLAVDVPGRQKKIFVAHGKNHVPLRQLEKILKEYDLPFVVAVDEPHGGRPIGGKVSQLMKDCTSGIFICTGDEKVALHNGTETMRPSDNVIYELGAASVLYAEKIIIFREEGVQFGSDFSALGHISFEKDKLEATGLQLLKELKQMGFLKFTLS